MFEFSYDPYLRPMPGAMRPPLTPTPKANPYRFKMTEHWLSNHLTDICIHASYLLINLASAFRDIFKLRLLTIGSGLFAILYGILTNENPFIYWETILVTISAWQVIVILRERGNLKFSDEELRLKQTTFNHFSFIEFKRLLDIGTFINTEKGKELTKEGKKVLRIILIVRGAVDVTMNGEVVAYRVAGDLIGEISFISGERARATVRTIEQTRYIMWLQDDLRKLLQSHVSMQTAMQTVFNKGLIHKLLTVRPQM